MSLMRAKEPGRGMGLGLRTLALAGLVGLASAGPLTAEGESGAPAPDQFPAGGNGGTGGGGKRYVVHARPGEDLGDAIARVRRGGKLILHAGRGGAGRYDVPRRLEIQKSITIMAAQGDEGHVELVFRPYSRCLDITPNFLGWRDRDGDGAMDPPRGTEDKGAAARGKDDEDGPDDADLAARRRGYVDEDMCRQPRGDDDFAPTPANTVALCGLRITRELPESGVKEGDDRAPACISVWRRKLYVERTKIDAGVGPAIDAAASPQVRMGTSQPGGIDRSVFIWGLGKYGVRVDRKSELLLEWTEIGGFKTGVWADGNINLKRGLQINNNKVGLLISGGTDDADIFGPRDISIGVDMNVLPGSSPKHEDPEHKRPEIFDNEVGILIGRNFEGRIKVLSADISCRFDCEHDTGIEVQPSKFSPRISIKETEISRQLVGIKASGPVHIGPDVLLMSNVNAIEFTEPIEWRRTQLKPYNLRGINFVTNLVDMKFSSYVDTELRLCDIPWPKRERVWDPASRKRVEVGGVHLAAESGAGFYKCFVSDLRRLKRSLWESSGPVFERVCKSVVTYCPGPSADAD